MLRIDAHFNIHGSSFKLLTLIDNASSHSFINPQCLPQHVRDMINRYVNSSRQCNNELNLRVYPMNIETISSSERSYTIHLDLNVVIEGVSLSHTFIICDQVQKEQAIFGLDFIRRHNLIFNPEFNTITIGKSNKPQTVVRVQSRMVIPPHSERVVPVSICTLALVNRLCLIEPFNKQQNGLLLGKSLNKLDSKANTNVLLCNYFDYPITLRCNQTIGTVQEIDETCVVSLNDNLNSNENVFDKLHINDALTVDQKQQLTQLLKQNIDIFSQHQFDIGCTNLLEYAIDVGNASPIQSKPYHVPIKSQLEIERQITELLKHQIIEPSFSPWSSPIVLVKKKNGQYRFCIDFRKLNAVTLKDAFPLPRVDDMLDNLKGSKYFTILDLSNGYWQIPMKASDKDKTAFCTSQGLYHWKRLPYGPINGPKALNRLMKIVFSGLTWKQLMIYFDDLFVYSPSFEQHLVDLDLVFSRIRAAHLKLQPSKCVFATQSIKFLGHVVTSEGIMPDPDKTQLIHQLPTPKNASQLKSFLGMVQYYKRFIPDLSKIAKPLYQLTKANIRFKWNLDSDLAFQTLKQKLITPPLLNFPDFDKPFVLQTDASLYGLGAVLSQNDELGRDHPIAFASRLLSDAETRYTTIERELLAIVWALKHFQHFIYRHPIIIITDNKPIVDLKRVTQPQGRLAKLFYKLQQYDYKLIHKPG